MAILEKARKEFKRIGELSMIAKSYKDDRFEIVVQQNESNMQCSVCLIKDNKQVEFQGNLDMETALEVYDYYFDKMMGFDLKDWNE